MRTCKECGKDLDIGVGLSLMKGDICMGCFNKPPQPREETVLQEATRLISSDRNKQYGSWSTEIGRVMDIMNVLYPKFQHGIDGHADCVWGTRFMIVLKAVRETNKHKRDNNVDEGGYIGLLAQVEGEDNVSKP